MNFADYYHKNRVPVYLACENIQHTDMSIGILIQPVPPILSLSKIISLSRGLGHSGVFVEFRKTMRR